MRFLAIDIETTGLSFLHDEILQVAAVVEDTESSSVVESLPTFECLIALPRIEAEPFVLNMHADLIAALSQYEMGDETIAHHGRDIPAYAPGKWGSAFLEWVQDQFEYEDKVVAAGKNAAGFDLPFIYRDVPEAREVFDYRVIDPGSVAMGARPELWKDKGRLPSLDNIIPGLVTHDALDDARAVIKVLRALR